MTFRLESTGQLPPDRGTAAPDPYPGATWAPRSLAARYRQSPRPTLVRMWKEHSPNKNINICSMDWFKEKS